MNKNNRRRMLRLATVKETGVHSGAFGRSPDVAVVVTAGTGACLPTLISTW